MKKLKFKKLVFFGLVTLLFNSAGLHVFADDAQQKLVEQVQVEQVKTNKMIEEEKIKEEKIKRFREAFLKACETKHQNGDANTNIPKNLLEVEKFKEEADKLYTAMVNFVAESDKQGVSAENFDDFVREYILKNSSGPMQCLDRTAFEEYAKKPGMRRLYRGVAKKEYLESFRQGNAYIGGRIRGSLYFFDGRGSRSGHCIYTGVEKDGVDSYALKRDEIIENKQIGLKKRLHGRGGVLEMVVDDDNINSIEEEHLDCICVALLFYHPEIGMAYELFDQGYPIKVGNKNYGDDGFNEFHYKCFCDAFKQVFNFDLSELLIKLKPDYKNLDFKEQKILRETFLFLCYGKLLDNFPKFREKFFELLKKEIKVNPHYTDKLYALLCDDGILAKLLGYDAIKQSYIDRNGERVVREYDIVNPGIITVCTDDSDDVEEPTLENIEKLLNNELERRQLL